MILDGLEGIKQLQKHYKKNLMIMFLIKDEEEKYLISKNPFFNTQFSFPCFHLENTDNIGAEINHFLLHECKVVGHLDKFLERAPNVCYIDNNLITVEFMCLTLKKEEEFTKEKIKAETPEPSGKYKSEKFVPLQELKTMFYKNQLNSVSMFFALRDAEIPMPSGNTTITFDSSIGAE
ncbi:hypothetical protein FUSNEC_GEN_294_05150 [Fusobacterium necrophorum subsp. funduliforme]|uniref:hypothetical protein n=1 Tax=Fusobacterium necrophorum TaxID=859 RepID=UPI00370DF91D